MESPQYIKALLKPNGSKPKGRKVWSVDLEAVWLPFFTATNLTGDTAIPHDAMGAPLRLAYDADGSVKFGKTGRPVIRVAKELADSVKLVRENLIAGLMDFTHGVIEDNPEGYQAQVDANMAAGQPIVAKDSDALTEAMRLIALAQQAEAKAERSKGRKADTPETAKETVNV